MNPIILESEGRTFYGTRWAEYILDFPNFDKLRAFANDLQRSIITTNVNLEEKDTYYWLKLRRGVEGDPITFEESGLFKTLTEREKIQLIIRSKRLGESVIANLIYRFKQSDSHRDRTFVICPYSIPNDVITFDSSFLYDLGKKYGKLVSGDDFEITLTGFTEFVGVD
jgi:hypothetical protein